MGAKPIREAAATIGRRTQRSAIWRVRPASTGLRAKIEAKIAAGLGADTD
ncbi:MAG: hypothetical protein AVDCRST_MAG67-1936 [uncultured Solirubrobacteraceae bacterium]|uniref:Uncharacterized protein n=1 Tax=uncultured Solirubrobacteraceae bacterium TaxID=1162706 RepID=A0A6J4SLG3_9ACTN|nr:MAG: hypothetical protein AVDCRST_MAG67-1936 [uncultured Solirubrobacteraceae bacterium]